MGLISQKLYDNKDAKFIPLRYITFEDAKNKGFPLKEKAQPILLGKLLKIRYGLYQRKNPFQ